jgi:threonine/homoserine/homoserine lactone efflux protein
MTIHAFSILWPVALFALIGFFSPGPNTIIATSIGLRSGWRAAWAHAWGVCVGFSVMLSFAASGTAAAVWLLPGLDRWLRWAAAAYLCWCAWKIATSPVDELSASGPPQFSFLQSLGFQFVNPKAWMLAASASGAYPQAVRGAVAPWALLMLAAIAAGSIMFWAALGAELRRVLNTPARRRAFNACMGAALSGCAAWVLLAA